METHGLYEVDSVENTPVINNASPWKFNHTTSPKVPPKGSNEIADLHSTSPVKSLSPRSPDSLASGSSRRSRRSQDRVPGGAAAKLLGYPSLSLDSSALGSIHVEESIEEIDALDQEISIDLSKLEEVRERTKEEWSKGTESNTRYMPLQPVLGNDNEEKKYNEDCVPRALTREQVVPENANASVVSLLTPDPRLGGSSAAGSAFDDAFITAVSPEKALAQAATPKASAFRNPFTEETPSPAGSTNDTSMVSPANGKRSLSGNGVTVLDTTYGSRPPTVKPLITPATKGDIDVMKVRMRNPSRTLSELLTAICTPDDDTRMDRGFMVRRKNACGALKVLTAKPQNRRTICFTVGVLAALTSVLEDSGDEGVVVQFPDKDTRFEYLEARKRAVANLLNLAMPKENRTAVFHSPGLVKALVKTIQEDDEESRQGCCAILAYLARTVDNRLLMVHVPELVNTITGVIDPEAKENTKDVLVRSFFKSRGVAVSPSTQEDVNNDTTMTDESGTDGYSSSGSENVHSSFDDADDEHQENSHDSDETPQISPSLSPRNSTRLYDKHSNKQLSLARQNVFAVLSHLVKEKDNAFHLARNEYLISSLVAVAKLQDSTSQKHAVTTLANLTRHRDNCKWMVFRLRTIVPAFVIATYSESDQSRKYACYGLQNLSQEKTCRQEVANTTHLLVALCQRARYATDPEEKLAAISTLKNLTDEPANLVPMTNAPECLATFMQIAHGGSDDITELMQYKACDGLATLSHWLRKIATSGVTIKKGPSMKDMKPRPLFVPSLKCITWEQWE